MIRILIGVGLFLIGSIWLSFIIAVGVSTGIKDQFKNLENIIKK